MGSLIADTFKENILWRAQNILFLYQRDKETFPYDNNISTGRAALIPNMEYFTKMALEVSSTYVRGEWQ